MKLNHSICLVLNFYDKGTFILTLNSLAKHHFTLYKLNAKGNLACGHLSTNVRHEGL